MKNLTLYILLFVGLLQATCTKKSENVKVSIGDQSELNFSVDTLQIAIGSKYANYFEIFSPFMSGNKPKLMAYDAYNHSLLTIDLSETVVEDTKKIELNGVNGVSTIEGLHVQDPDSILVYERGKVKMLNKNMQVVTTHEIANLPGGFGFLYTNYKFKLRFLPSQNAVLLENSFRGNRELAIDNPAIAMLNIATGKLELVPVMYSEYVKKNEGSFGYQFGINFDYTNDNQIFYTFPVQSEIFTYDLTTGVTQQYEAASHYTPNRVEPLANLGNRDEGRINFIESPAFYGVLGDLVHGLHYRIHRDGKPFNPLEDEFNAIADVHFYITVLDQKMSYLGEIKLPKNVYTQYTWFVFDGSLYLTASSDKYVNLREDVLELHKFTFKMKEKI